MKKVAMIIRKTRRNCKKEKENNKSTTETKRGK